MIYERVMVYVVASFTLRYVSNIHILMLMMMMVDAAADEAALGYCHLFLRL